MIAQGLNFLLSGWSGRGLLAALLAFAIAIPWLVGDQSYVTYLVFTFFVFAVFGHAWNLLAGYCGLLSFGNQVYVGIGGFTLAILFYYGGINVWLALPISGIVTAAFAFLLATPVRESLVGIGVWKPVAIAGVLWAGYEVALGYFPEADIFGEVYIRRVIILLLIFLGALPLLRLQGAYFAVASWLIAAAVGSIFNEWKVVGAGGGMQIKTDATQVEMYYAGLGLLVFATVVIARLLKSRYGLALTAVRDDEEAARTAGIDIRKVKLIVFVVAGGLSGLAAGLFYIDAVIITPPAAFTIFWSAYFVFIVVAGGMGTLAGPIVGAAIFVVVDRVLSGVTEYPLLVLGIAAVVIIFVMPRGAMGIVNALRHLDDSATGRNELLEALGIGDRLQRSLFFARRRDTAPGVVAALLVPGSPLPLLARDNPPWTEIADGLEEAAAALHEAKPDVILVYSTQWLAVLDQPWQTRPRVRGLHVDENWYEYGEIDYDFEIDTELAEACIGACRSLGIKARGVNYDGFPIDTGSIVANRFLNANGNCAVVMAANNLYHDWEQTLKLGEMAANQAVRLGRRVAVVGVGGLSGSAFRHEIDPADDRIASESEDAWNRRMLDMMVKGDASAMKAQIADYAREARADMGFKHFAWVLGAIGGRFHSATVHAYGPTYGSGAAVVEFHASEEQGGSRDGAAKAPAAAGAAGAGGASPRTGGGRRRRAGAPALAPGGFAQGGSRRSPVAAAASYAAAASRAPASSSAARPRALPLVPLAGRDRRAIRRREQRAGFRPLRGFLPLQQRARAQGAQTPARRALRPDDRRDPRHLSGGARRCADPHVHSRRLLALAQQQGVQLRGRGPGGGRGDGGDQQLRALPGGHDHGDRAPEPRRSRMALPQCRNLRRQPQPHPCIGAFGRRPSDGHAARDRLGARFRPAGRPRQGRHRDQRPVRPRALRSLMAAAHAPPDRRRDRPDEPDPPRPGPRLPADRHVRRRRIRGVPPAVRELSRRLDREGPRRPLSRSPRP